MSAAPANVIYREARGRWRSAALSPGTAVGRTRSQLYGAGVLDTGASATIVDGPVDADGYSWYEVSTAAGDGWVDGEYLALSDTVSTASGFAVEILLMSTTCARRRFVSPGW